MTDFETLYRQTPDPWSVKTAWYERRKRSLLMACLPRERYRYALELGCGTGDITTLLASRCNAVCAVDTSETAVGQCLERLASDHISNANVQMMHIPSSWPELTEQADLIVASELFYYFCDLELDKLLARCLQTLIPGGDWLMCHYTEQFHDRRQNTEKMHNRVDELPGLHHLVSHGDASFRLDIWRKLERGEA
ncbi:class I SAM-dependent methyltransferase [Paenalcaligenes niemegkensis]|uniref:class I SAM-dependent DNA methyltransferase n=1 Tax=Paenalcaligenes niemegkensis TaxID=2895469 RepID=UPI001EE96BB1|nr:class I SAM-dependent methyltransferase [Paenalcaligenes niemegkensis]MCQ9615706.1 class I SAM-dependent methyltransferase [Paenalcaligenes niemegkensis]